MKRRFLLIGLTFVVLTKFGYAQHIGQSSAQYNGSIYHLGGNVGIGTATPFYKLDIGSSSRSGVINVTNDNYGDWVLQKSRSDNTQIVGFKSFANGELGVCANNVEVIRLNSAGNVGIGTINLNYKLVVKGSIGSGEVKVEDVTNWPDFVFKPNYILRPLSEVEQFIKANSHLPEIPSENEVKENGVGFGEMNAKLLQKV